MLLSGKSAVVTGGGRGIGRGITEKLLKAGARVLVAQRHDLPSDLLADSHVHFMRADLADANAPSEIARAAAEIFDGVDVLVNNAGFMFEKAIGEMEVSDWDQLMAVNLRAPAFLSARLLPQLRQRGGCIVNVGSIEGFASNPQHAAYASSKAGLHGLTRALAVDLGPHGVRCNAIAPGWIDSDLSDAYLGAQEDPTGARAALLKLHPVGRTGTPPDVGSAVVFLASDEAAFVTGQVLVIDGGRTAKLPLPF